MKYFRPLQWLVEVDKIVQPRPKILYAYKFVLIFLPRKEQNNSLKFDTVKEFKAPVSFFEHDIDHEYAKGLLMNIMKRGN